MNKKKWKQKFAYRDSRRWIRKTGRYYSQLHGQPEDRNEIRDVVLEYPQLEREYNTYKHQQAYRINRGKRVEDALEPPRSERWRGMIAVREAKGITVHRMYKGHTALKLLNLMYWPRKGEEPLRLGEAARALGLTFNKATQLHDGFFRLVEERMRLKKRQVW